MNRPIMNERASTEGGKEWERERVREDQGKWKRIYTICRILEILQVGKETKEREGSLCV